MYRCKICDKEYSSLRSFSKHVSQTHRDIQTENKSAIHVYYDLYMIKDKESTCLKCGKPTTFLGLYGYKEYCSKSCGIKASKEKLRDNEEAFSSFRKTVSKNQTRIWKERDSETKEDIIAKIQKGKIDSLENMSEEERKETYGWLNKVPEEYRQETIERITKPLKEYWSNSEKALETINKRADTLRKTWDERGDEIIAKMEYTMVMNCNPDGNGRLDITEEELIRTNNFLEEVCYND